MGGMTDASLRRTDAHAAKLAATVAMWLYVAWMATGFFLPLSFHVQLDARYVLDGVLSLGTRAALAAALRSLTFIVIDRLAPPPRPTA